MANLDTIGSTAATYQGYRKRWNYGGAETEEGAYEGPVAAAEALYALLKTVAGYNPDYDGVEIEAVNGVGKVGYAKVTDGDSVYEMWPNLFYKPIYQHTYFTADLTATQIAAVRSMFEQAELTDPAASGFAGKQLELYAALCHGDEESPEAGYVLRVTQEVSKRSTVQASYVGVNTVVSPPDTSAANSLIGALPTGEWLKQPPIVRMIGRRKWQIAQEYWWALLWHVRYGGTLTYA